MREKERLLYWHTGASSSSFKCECEGDVCVCVCGSDRKIESVCVRVWRGVQDNSSPVKT